LYREELIWWGVTSCSTDINVIKSFLSINNSILFLIEISTGRNLAGYTKYPNEHEVILPPATRLRIVANSMEHAGGLHVVHLCEVAVDEAAQGRLGIPSIQLASVPEPDAFGETYGEAIHVCDNGRACEHPSFANYNGCALGNRRYSKGVHRIRLTFEYGTIFMGILSDGIKPKEWLVNFIEMYRFYNTPSAHGWDSDGYVTINGQIIKNQWTTVKNKDVFEFTLDCDARKLDILNERTGHRRDIAVDLGAAPLPWRLFVIFPWTFGWGSRVCLL